MRLSGLWWWIDRWRKSTAYMDMTLEQQGAYRNLLDEAHLRGGALPDDDRILAKACGDARAWKRLRPSVMSRFHLKSDGWHNETLDAVIADSQRRADKQRNYRNRLGNAQGNAVPFVPVTERDLLETETVKREESERERRKGPPTISERAGAFCQWYENTHERLFGIGYMGTNLDYQKALELCGKFTDQQLRDAALVWFGDEDKFASEGTRSIPKFASRVSGYLQTIKAKGLAS